ncbi:Integrase/recombinase, N-terminal [Moorella glycerini]|uniref:Site-specific tyrosine recombinase XerC n=1 Tax=Neomoorella stamsii TaxID=1266720 RepID=A0A9X7J1E8_9FIRM|nr:MULTISPECIES: site-specific integrase [Moorella]PRR71849.1 site-specific tyrosine recombinase XerC [Moorella stamsii]CEP66067.1 Integrase/recombinase, N-terminal [Moorella glycerini]
MTEALSRYFFYLKETDSSHHTVTGYRKDLQAFARWYGETCGEEPEPEKITSIDLREYQSWMRNVRPQTQHGQPQMKALKSWLGHARLDSTADD